MPLRVGDTIRVDFLFFIIYLFFHSGMFPATDNIKIDKITHQIPEIHRYRFTATEAGRQGTHTRTVVTTKPRLI